MQWNTKASEQTMNVFLSLFCLEEEELTYNRVWSRIYQVGFEMRRITFFAVTLFYLIQK